MNNGNAPELLEGTAVKRPTRKRYSPRASVALVTLGYTLGNGRVQKRGSRRVAAVVCRVLRRSPVSNLPVEVSPMVVSPLASRGLNSGRKATSPFSLSATAREISS